MLFLIMADPKKSIEYLIFVESLKFSENFSSPQKYALYHHTLYQNFEMSGVVKVFIFPSIIADAFLVLGAV